MSDNELARLRQQLEHERTARQEVERLLEVKSRELFFATQQLHNARERNQHYLDIVQTILIALDSEGRISMANRAGCTLLGQSESELLGKRWFKYFVPPSADAEAALHLFQQLVASEIQTGEAQSEYPILDKNGQEHVVAWRLSTVTDAAGQIVGVLGAGEDITERKLAEKGLAHERFLLQALMNSLPDHVYFKDRDSRFLLANTAMAISFGMDDPSGVLGKTDFDFFTEEHARQAFEDEQAIIRTSQPLTIEERETWPDRPDTWVSSTKIPLRDEKGNIVGTFGVSRNITERRQAEARIQSQMLELTALNNKLSEAQSQLLQSEKMAAIGQLAAGVAHEINNPIGFVTSNFFSLKTYTGQLLSVIDTYEQGNAEKIAHVRQAVEIDFLRKDLPALLSESQEGLGRVAKIVQDLKNFSRVDDTGRQLADLNAAMESTLNVVWNELKYKAEVIRELGDIPNIDCIPAQINQVFTNLLVNAAQAIPERGKIFVRSRQEAETVCFEIEDTGQGISEDVQRRIFEPFFTTKPVGKGTGLGLSISYDIVVKKHGGRLEVSSTPGKGTRFLVVLPLVFKGQDE